MNLVAARVTLRPRALTDVLDLTLPFCLQGGGVILRLGCLLLLPPIAGCLYLRWGQAWSWRTVWVVAIVAADLIEGAFVQAAGELLFRPPAEVRVRSLLSSFLRRTAGYLVVYVVGRAAVMLSLSTIVGLPFVAPRFLFVREALLLEGSSPGRALMRSIQLARREAFPCLGLALALVVAPVLCVLAAEMLGQSVLRFVLQMGTPAGDLMEDGGSAFAIAGLFLSVPVTASARFLKYIDIRTRKEGWDIQLRFNAVAAAETASRVAVAVAP